MPREISSRSLIVRASRERRRKAGAMPPLRATTPKIEAACLPKALPISLSDSPFFHRSQSSAFRSADNPGRPICAMHTSRSLLDQVVLRRSIEPTTVYLICATAQDKRFTHQFPHGQSWPSIARYIKSTVSSSTCPFSAPKPSIEPCLFPCHVQSSDARHS